MGKKILTKGYWALLCAGSALIFVFFGYGLALNAGFLACYGFGGCSMADYSLMFGGEAADSWAKPAQLMAVQFWVCFAAGWFFKYCERGLRGEFDSKSNGSGQGRQ